jgi:hypothetical protein
MRNLNIGVRLMTFTAVDVASLSKSLSRWESAEYVFATLVAVACAGEYVADFTDWFTGGIEEQKKRLAKRSTLLLIAALALELTCLVKTNSISGLLIGSLSDKAEKADTKAQSAFDKAGEALGKSNVAKDAAGMAQDKVGVVAKQADDLLTKYLKAENDLGEERKARSEYEAKNAPRRLSSEQAKLIKSRLLRFKVWTINITADGKSTEILDFASDIENVFRSAGFTVDSKQVMMFFEPGATSEQQRGLTLLYGAKRNKDAEVLLEAFRESGLTGVNKPIHLGETGTKDELALQVLSK